MKNLRAETSALKETLARLDIRRSTFYGWLKRYEAGGIDALKDGKPNPNAVWNKLSEDEQDAIVGLAWKNRYRRPEKAR